MRAARDDQPVDDLYEAYWKDFDEKGEDGAGGKGTKFWKKVERQGRLRSSRLDLLLFHYVGLRTREDIKVTHVFEEFKSWWGERRDLSGELSRLNHIAHHFETFLAPGQKTRFELFCRRLKLLDTATPTPLVFYLLEHHAPDDPDFEAAIADIESYLVRRFVCGLTTKGYNRIFLKRLLSELVEENRWDSGTLRKKLLGLSGDSQVWPNDALFREDWCNRRLYQGSSTRRVRAVLEALELASTEYGQELGLKLESLSVEHVLPQKWKPDDYPLAPDGNGEARRRLLHCIGTLTLVTPGFNGALSNEAFRIKRPEIVRESTLRLNAYFQSFSNEDVWNEKAIVTRAESLFPLALKTWPYPSNG